jgi:RimJ/RimL family protein N-acetyltransferase
VSSHLASRLPVWDGPTVVRVLRRSDLDRFQRYRSDEALARYQAWTPMTVDQARAFLEAAAGVVDLVAGIRAVTDARNLASIGVLERAGFRFASQQPAVFKGEPCIEFVYRRRRIRAPASARRTRPPAPPRRAAASRTRR